MIPTTKPSGWVLVSGGSRGIGRGIVTQLARNGYDVVFTYKDSHASARELVAALHEEGHPCASVACDGRDPTQVEACVAALIAEKGAPYALINNLGIARDGTILTMSSETPLDVLTNNVGSAFWFIQAVSQAMIARRDGVIIQMSSISAFRGNPGQSAYAASKAALIGMARTLAVELGRFNLRVNAIAPGLIDTDMLSNMPEAHLTKLKSMVPLRRIGSVSDVASVVEFLLSPAASYITGTTLVVDGGLSS